MGIVFSKVINPPKKILINDYVCDKQFMLDHILEMYEPGHKVGIVLISGNITMIYNISKTGSHIEQTLTKVLHADLQKRQKKGGQSAPRIGRLRDEKENRYIKHIAETIINTYMFDNNTKYSVQGLVIAGSSNIKNKVIDVPIFQQYFSELVIKVMDIEVTDNVIYDIIKQDFIFETRDNSIEKVQELIEQASDKLVFGEKSVLKYLGNCLLETIYIDINEDVKKVANTYGAKIIKCNLSKIQIPFIGVKFF